MPLEYSIITDLQPEQLDELMQNTELDLESVGIVYDTTSVPSRRREVIAEVYQIFSRSRITLWPTHSDCRSDAVAVIIRLVDEILGLFRECTCLFIFNGELPILFSKSGKTTLSSSAGFWTNERLQIFSRPHELGDLEVL